tara:strand:+ start:6397 stop:6807 length:411 start_codon:yes stop_codon:yes gene_type:complete
MASGGDGMNESYLKLPFTQTTLEQMKKFASMSDEEREMEIKKAQWAMDADEDYQITSLAAILKDRNLDSCCETPLFTVRNLNELVFYFNKYGEIVSELFDVIPIDDVYCNNCEEKVKTPQSYIDEWVADSIVEAGA